MGYEDLKVLGATADGEKFFVLPTSDSLEPSQKKC